MLRPDSIKPPKKTPIDVEGLITINPEDLENLSIIPADFDPGQERATRQTFQPSTEGRRPATRAASPDTPATSGLAVDAKLQEQAAQAAEEERLVLLRSRTRQALQGVEAVLGLESAPDKNTANQRAFEYLDGGFRTNEDIETALDRLERVPETIKGVSDRIAQLAAGMFAEWRNKKDLTRLRAQLANMQQEAGELLQRSLRAESNFDANLDADDIEEITLH